MDVGEGQNTLSGWWPVKVVITGATASTLCLCSLQIPRILHFVPASLLCRQCSSNGPLSTLFNGKVRIFLSQRPLTRFCPHSSGTDDFKPPRKGVSSSFPPHFRDQNNPWLPVPAGVLCIQWRLATENAGRSNQSCFTSLDPLPELGCRLAAAKKRLLLYIGWLVT